MTYLDQYKIQGTINYDENPVFGVPSACPDFQQKLEQFKIDLKGMVDRKENKTFYKFGDGDYYFLKGVGHGSAAPGKRALSVPYWVLNMEEFRSGVLQNDYFTVELYNKGLWNELFPERPVDYLAEFGYGLTSNKWLLREFKGRIGIMGGDEKITLIKELMKYPEYQEYLGLDKFEDYLSIPQKFACDNLAATEKMIADQLAHAKSDIILMGIGHVKSGLSHRLKKYHSAVYLDVGSGIDAIAGCIEIERPFMGAWINYRLSGYDYSTIDYLNYHPTSQEVILK
jgi:hypothetical protein